MSGGFRQSGRRRQALAMAHAVARSSREHGLNFAFVSRQLSHANPNITLRI